MQRKELVFRMDAQAFAAKWKGAPLVRFALSALSAEDIRQPLRAALQGTGLPQTAEPWLRFMEILRTDARTGAALAGRQYYPIGCLPSGDLICLDKRSEQVMICDHENSDTVWMLNSSLGALYESLLLFAEFIEEVNRRNPRFASDFKIPDGMLPELAERLKACDPVSFAEKGFWYTEIQALDDSVL